MNKARNRLAAAIAATSLLGVALPWQAIGAETPTAREPRHAVMHGPMGMHDAGMMGPMRGMMRDLGLSTEQREQIRAIMANAWQQGDAERKALQDIRAQVEAAIAEGPFDEARVRTLIERGAPLMTEAAVRMARTMAEVRAVLTPGQRVQMDERRAEMRERMAERRARRDKN